MSRKGKYIVLSALAIALTVLLGAGPVAQAAPAELFFSEYVEGSSYNKALEIYNGTGAEVDLSTYTVELYSNGATSASSTAALNGTLADGDVFVIANASADAAILAVTDLTSSVANFNGDDAVVLKNGGAVADSFGQVGVDPGSEWPGGGVDDTLRRKSTVCAGDTDTSDAFDASVEWDTFSVNTFDGLGSHTANCADPVPSGQPLPLSEGFDDCTLAGWEIISVDADAANTWSCSATNSNVDANGYGDAAPANEWLITPSLDLDAQDNDTLTFRNYTNYTDVDYPQLSVLYSTDYTGSGDPTSATWTEFSGINFSPEGSGTWVDSGEVDLSGISGTNVHIAFHYISSGTGGGTAANWRLDSIEVFEKTVTPPPPPPPAASALVISGVVDGPLTGGIPKAVEFYAISDIADLSAYGFGSANNGGGSDGQEFTFPATAVPAGSYLYVASETNGFTSFFGFAPNYTSSAADINGDDAIELFQNGNVVDVFGDINVDGTGQPWEYMDGWAYRVDNTGPDGSTFVIDNWTFSGPNALDNETTNASATTPFPIGTFFTQIPGQPLPLEEGFDDCTLAGWDIISVDTDTFNTWSCNATYSNIEANGFRNTAPANEWLITPALNMNAQDNDRLTFRSQTGYTDSGLAYPQLEVLYSANYDGSGDPTTATWIELSGITFSPENSETWTDSGEVDLSGISGSNVYFAFHYMSSGTNGGEAAYWRLDGINFYERTGPFPYKIHEIQGSGLSSPVVGEQVIIEGVVVGDFQDLGQFGGFHVQEEDIDADADPATSEGIFVYHYSTPVNIGDTVQVVGTVAEYNGLTEITAVSSVTPADYKGDVTPTAVTLPVTSLDDLEAYEGMLVTFEQDLYISEFFNFDRYNEIVLSTERQYQPTAVYDPGSPEATALMEANVLSRITLDDGRSTQNPDPALHPNGMEYTTSNTFRGGDILQNVTGVMDYANGVYKIQPTTGAVYVPQNARTDQPDDVGGAIKVASFNVLNYFSTIDTGDPICGPAADQECRGADTPEEFQRQRDKIFAALAAIDADVVGLIEIENHATDAAVQDLVTGLNEYLGNETYAYVATGPIGTDAIKVAFIYKPASVKLASDYAILDSSVDARFLDDYNRPALAQTFYDRYTGGHFTVVVNHLKSKGSDCNAVGDPDLGDGAGNCNLTRTAAAQAMVDWLATDPTDSGDPDFLIIGDLNSYDKEDPIDAILAGADDVQGSGDDYTDLLYNFIGEYAYSYVFDGQLGYLDHGLANATLLPQVAGTTAWHINSDEPDIIDYDMNYKEDAQDALWEPTPYRSSDHDPVVIGLQLEPEGLIVNDYGCYVIGLEGTPYSYAYNLVTTDHRSLKTFRWGGPNYMFKALVWAFEEGVSRRSCFEIHGTDKKDMILAGFGDDEIFGYGRQDMLLGLRGDDVFSGGNGRDFLIGGSGYDTVLDYEKGDKCVSIEEGCPSHKGGKKWK